MLQLFADFKTHNTTSQIFFCVESIHQIYNVTDNNHDEADLRCSPAHHCCCLCPGGKYFLQKEKPTQSAEATQAQSSYMCDALILLCLNPMCTYPKHVSDTSAAAQVKARHTGRGPPCNRRKQIMEHTAVNGSVHTGCKQHQRVYTQICAQICLRVLCEWGLTRQKLCLWGNKENVTNVNSTHAVCGNFWSKQRFQSPNFKLKKNPVKSEGFEVCLVFCSETTNTNSCCACWVRWGKAWKKWLTATYVEFGKITVKVYNCDYAEHWKFVSGTVSCVQHS